MLLLLKLRQMRTDSLRALPPRLLYPMNNAHAPMFRSKRLVSSRITFSYKSPSSAIICSSSMAFTAACPAWQLLKKM